MNANIFTNGCWDVASWAPSFMKNDVHCVIFLFCLSLGNQTFSRLVGGESLHPVFTDCFGKGSKWISYKCVIYFMMWLLFTPILTKTFIYFTTALFPILSSDQTVSLLLPSYCSSLGYLRIAEQQAFFINRLRRGAYPWEILRSGISLKSKWKGKGKRCFNFIYTTFFSLLLFCMPQTILEITQT